MVQTEISRVQDINVNDIRYFVDITPPSTRAEIIAGIAGVDLCVHAVICVGGDAFNGLFYDGGGSRFLTVYSPPFGTEMVNPYPYFWRLTTGNGLEANLPGGAGNEEIHVWYSFKDPL